MTELELKKNSTPTQPGLAKTADCANSDRLRHRPSPAQAGSREKRVKAQCDEKSA